MKGKDLFQAMGEISDRYIEEAAPDEKTLDRMASSKENPQILSMESGKNTKDGYSVGTKTAKTKGSKRKWYQNPRVLGGLTTAAAVLLLVGIGIHSSGLFTGGLTIRPFPSKQNDAGAENAEYVKGAQSGNGSASHDPALQGNDSYHSGEKNGYAAETNERAEEEKAKSYTEEVKSLPQSFAYRKVACSLTEREVKRGFAVYDSENANYPYRMDIWSGPRSTGGYDIEVTNVRFDGETLTVTVRETSPKPEDVVTEAFTYPGCGIEFTIFPEHFVVQTEDGTEIPPLEDW